MNMNDPKKVMDMYIKKDTLSTRINLHGKYSVNKYGWYNWVFDQYNLNENNKVLEFGCGTGGIWIGRDKQIPENVQIILTDISPLMIEKTKEKLDINNIFSFQVMDIQDIPFSDECFDIIIANHMLYHVPNMEKALSEIIRVLKSDGIFYATTNGKSHLKELQDMYKENEISFTLENGKEILNKYFSTIDQKLYIDSLEVTDVNDLMDYIVSSNNISKEI